MRQVTFAGVRTSIQVRYDLPDFSTTTKPTTSQINVMINQSAARLSALLVASFGDDYFTTTATITTTASVATSTLPTDFYKLRQLIWLRSTDDPVTIERASLDDFAYDSLMTATTWDGYDPVYRFQGASTIHWLPTPNAAYAVTCVYVASPATLSSDGDTIDVGPGWEEWIVQDVCVRLAQMREEDPQVYMAERADCETRIRSQAPGRDPYALVQARDVRSTRLRGLSSPRGPWWGR